MKKKGSREIIEYLDEVRSRYDDWWEHRSRTPLFYMIFARDPGGHFDEPVKPWMAPGKVGRWTAWQHEFLFGQAVELAARDGDMRYVDEVCDYFERYAEATDRMADGYHFLFVNLGPAMMSAFLTGVTRFDGDTIWLERDEALSLDEVLALDDSCSSAYAQAAFAGIERLVQRLEGRFVFGIPELGDTLDVLAAMRRSMNLLMDVVEEPEKVDACCDRLLDLWYSLHGRLSSLIDPRNQGCYSMAMRLLSGKPAHCATCDFGAMIGPDLFARWALPQIRREIEHFEGRVIYHLDGPGELPHVDALLSLPGLHSIQWVPGAGKPGGLDPSWDGLYRRILDAGKRVYLTATPSAPEPWQAFFRRFPASEFFASVYVRDRAQAESILRATGAGV
jgi:5-methyltetrahydrofolate--homocysteine methyltransferase